MDKSLSLHIIAKDEEKNLPILINSVKDCVDEIYVVDTGSTDSTVEVAKRLGCKVEHFKWIDDFSAARNYSFQFGKTAFQLWLDCDDELKGQDQFKLWRDEVMPLSDYHLATYHYANDGKGSPTCSFVRERVVRRSMNFKWSYFLHEGLRPDSGQQGPVRGGVANHWSVWHRRTHEDLLKDRGRNLRMFQGRVRDLDARMKYYYGKELFEAGQLDQCLEWFDKAIVDTSLEPHDRILAFQYLGQAYAQLGVKQLEFAQNYQDQNYQSKASVYFHEAIGRSLDAIQLDPHRAEYYVNIGDSFVKTGQVSQAIPFYEAAKSCIRASGGNQASAVFHFGPLYSEYPRTVLTKAYSQLGMWDRAKAEAQDLYRLHPSEESKVLLHEVNQACAFNVIPADAKTCDDIVISCPPGMNAFPWDGEIYRTQFMGGSETAAIEMAENWAKSTGRKVKIFQNRERPLSYEGVDYLPVKGVGDYFFANKPYMHVAWRHSEKLTNAFTMAWCHDLQLPGGERTDNYDFVTALTPFHKRRLMAEQGIPESKIFLTRNGLNPGKFITEAIERDPNRFVFSSSPDRGLDRAMMVLDRVREYHPDISMHVHYGIEHLHRYGLGALQDKLTHMMRERDWVKYVGKTSQSDLMRSFKASAYCIQPADWIETSMISALERLCCGVYQIMRAVGGAVDTLSEACAEGMAEMHDVPNHYGEFSVADADYYAAQVVKAMDEQRYKRVHADPAKYAWSKVADEWIAFREGQKS